MNNTQKTINVNQTTNTVQSKSDNGEEHKAVDKEKFDNLNSQVDELKRQKDEME